jgi:hypothetical protein
MSLLFGIRGYAQCADAKSIRDPAFMPREEAIKNPAFAGLLESG